MAGLFPLHTRLDFGDDFFRRYEIQNAKSRHFISHVLERGSKVINRIIHKQESVMFFQVTCGHSTAWILTSVVLLAGVVVSLVLIGRDQRKKKVFD